MKLLHVLCVLICILFMSLPLHSVVQAIQVKDELSSQLEKFYQNINLISEQIPDIVLKILKTLFVLPLAISFPIWTIIFLLTTHPTNWIFCIPFYLMTVFVIPYMLFFNTYGSPWQSLYEFACQYGIFITMVVMYVLYVMGCLIAIFMAPIVHEFFDFVPKIYQGKLARIPAAAFS